MPIFNKILNIMPYNCQFCIEGFLALQHVSEEAIKYGLTLIELKKEEANQAPVWDALATEDPMFVNGFGHGNASIYTGDSTSPIFINTMCDILAGRVVYLLSCYTAIELGPAIIGVGGVAFGGYNIPWTWIMDYPGIDPYNDWYGEGFYRATNEFPITLIQGETVAHARDRVIAEHNRWIAIWETERSDDKFAADAIKYHIMDRDGLVVLGDLSAPIAPGKTITTMIVNIEPPKYIKEAGQPFLFAGRLIIPEIGEPLPNRTVELWEMGQTTPMSTTKTDNDGAWSFELTLPKGVYSLQARFLGDDEYSRAYTPIYQVEVEVITPKIFGNPTRLYGFVDLPPDQIRGSWFTCPERGIAESITVWLEKPVTGRVKLVLYKKSDNSPTGYTEEAINPLRGLLTRKIIAGGILEATEYWIMFWSDARVHTTTSHIIGKAAVHFQAYNQFPDVLSPSTYNHLHRIYCTYTPTPFLPEHILTVNSVPITGVPVTADGLLIGNTPVSKKLQEGEHLIEVPQKVELS